MTTKKNFRRNVSFWRLIANLGLASILIILIIQCPGKNAFFHGEIALFVIGVPFFLLLGTYQADFLHFIPDAVFTLFSHSSEPSSLNAAICKSATRYFIGTGVTGTVGVIVWVLVTLDDPTTMGTGVATGVLPILYAFLAAGFFCYVYDGYSKGSPETENNNINTINNLALGAGMLALIFASLFSFSISFLSSGEHRTGATPTRFEKEYLEKLFENIDHYCPNVL